MVVLLEVVIDDGEVVKEDGHQVGAGEVTVAIVRDGCLDYCHAVEIAQEYPAGDTRALLGGGHVWLERRSPLLLPFEAKS